MAFWTTETAKPAPLGQVIPSDHEAHCTFEATVELGKINLGKETKEVKGSGYGKGSTTASRPSTASVRVADSRPKPSFKPETSMGKTQVKSRAASAGSRYGSKVPAKDIKKFTPAPLPKDMFKPKTNHMKDHFPRDGGVRLKAAKKLEAEVGSSGYADALNGTQIYSPVKGQHGTKSVRGEYARVAAMKKGILPPERNPTFQPKLHLSNKAKKMRETIREKKPLYWPRYVSRSAHASDSVPRVPIDPRFGQMPDDVMWHAPHSGFVVDAIAFSTQKRATVGNVSNSEPVWGGKVLRGNNLDRTSTYVGKFQPHAASSEGVVAPVGGDHVYDIHGRRFSQHHATEVEHKHLNGRRTSMCTGERLHKGIAVNA